MKIGMQIWGTTGDLTPFLLLAKGLSAAGHRVTLAITTPYLKDFSEDGKKGGFTIVHANKKSGKPLEELRHLPIEIFHDYIHHFYDDMIEAALELCLESDIVIGNDLTLPLLCKAEKMNVPYFSLSCLHYFVPSSHLAPPGVPSEDTESNHQLWDFVKRHYNEKFLDKVNLFRKREALPPVKNVLEQITYRGELNLITVSSVFCRQQADWVNHQVCGYFSDDNKDIQVLPDELLTFLSEGPPPLFFTVGSMSFYEPENLTKQLLDIFLTAIKITGCRAIVQVRQGALRRMPVNPSIRCIDYISYESILPHCAAIVHHGGIGTASLGLWCGCPSIVMEYCGHQWFVGEELHRIGVAPKLLHRKDVTSEALAAAIREVLTSSTMKENALLCSEIMKRENGVQRAVELIERKAKELNILETKLTVSSTI